MKFSVCMCVYGGDDAENFDTAVQSVIQQTLPPSEIILVVDGPVPQGLDFIIKKYEQNALFQIIRLETNQGHGNARRIALAHTSNDYVALMDADDISCEDRFAQQVAYAKEHLDVDVIGGNIEEFDAESKDVIGYRKVPEHDAEIKQYAKYRCPFNQMTVLLKKSKIDEVGGYIDWYLDEDYYLWIRMILNRSKFYNIPSVLVRVRGGAGMYQRRGGWKYFLSEARLQQYMWKKGFIRFTTCAYNIVLRFILQVLLPNRVRGFIFQKFARSGEGT